MGMNVDTINLFPWKERSISHKAIGEKDM
jgi:hypothetical protein